MFSLRSPSSLKKKANPYYIDVKDIPVKKLPHLTTALVKRGDGRPIPSRYICMILGFFCCVTLTGQRLNLSMALVAMVNSTVVFQSISNNMTLSECPLSTGTNASNARNEEGYEEGDSFDWNSETQNHIVSASFLGFVLTQIPAGRLAETMGAKKILIFSLILASICNIISPLAANGHPYALLVVQFVKGLSQGLVQPALTWLMAKWYPQNEKTFLSSLTLSGYPGGAIICGVLIGLVCDNSEFGGWPFAFYIFGIFGLLLSILIILFIFNNPDEDPRITEAEYKFIICNIDSNDQGQKLKTPWKSIMSCSGTWALFFAVFGQYWMTFFFVSVYPTYLGTALHLSHTESGYLNSIPYTGQIFITWMSSWLSDVLVNKGYASVDTARKICNTLGCIGFSLSLVGVTYAGCDKTLNIIFFVVAISCVGFGYPGSIIVPMDMTIRFAGTLMGTVCTFASTSGFIIPLVVGYITSTEQTLDQWSKVCYISAGVGVVSGLIFVLFGSARLKNWDAVNENDSKVEGAENVVFYRSTQEVNADIV